MTLMEILVSITLLGIGGVALMLGLGTVIKTGDINRQLAEADVALVLAATAATDESQVAYIPCGTPAQYNTASPRPDGWSATDLSITAVQYWNGTTFQPLVSACLDNDALAGNLTRVQHLTIRAIHPDGGATRTITIAKRGS